MSTWLNREELAYCGGALSASPRKARVVLRQNPNNPVSLPYGSERIVRVGIPDTYFTIPAVFRMRGKYIRGFVSCDDGVFTFTPNAQGVQS